MKLDQFFFQAVLIKSTANPLHYVVILVYLQDLNILFGFIDEKNERFSLALIIVFTRQSLVLSCNPQKYERDLIIYQHLIRYFLSVEKTC